MYITLVVRSGKKAGAKLRVSRRNFLIGRAEDCHLRPHSDVISRHHCALIMEEGYVGVKDFGSKNGTYVNGERVEGERALKHGDVIRVGKLELEVQLPDEMRKAAQAATATESQQQQTSSSDSEIDLVSLFGEPDQMASSETKTIGIGDSSLTNPSTEEEVAQPQTSEAAAELQAGQSSEPKKDADGVPVVGVPRGRYKPKAATPRDAAADALRKFFGYK